MLKITATVINLIQADELALEAARAKLLNLSAYAEKIHSQVANLTKKPVQKGTIVVALSRITKDLSQVTPPLKPDISLSNLNVHSSLCALTFEKSLDIIRTLAVLNPFQISISDLFSVTEGPNEVTLIVSESSKGKIAKQFRAKPKSEIADLVAVTVQYSKKLADTPNLHFVLFNSLANHRIKVVQVISTLTETTFIVPHSQMEETIKQLNTFLKH